MYSHVCRILEAFKRLNIVYNLILNDRKKMTLTTVCERKESKAKKPNSSAQQQQKRVI